MGKKTPTKYRDLFNSKAFYSMSKGRKVKYGKDKC